MSTPSLFREVFPVTSSYPVWTESWLLVLRLLSRVAGWEWRRSPFGHDSAFYTSAIQHPHCVTTAELMSPSSPWELRNGELIGRHFIIGSWWLNRGLSFSISPISSFAKVQNVWSVSQVWQLSLESNCGVYGTSRYRMSDLTKTRVNGCFP